MAKLPTWEECDDKNANLKAMTALEQLIYDWEPTEEYDALAFRAIVADVLDEQVEQAAKVAENMRPSGGRMWTEEQSACFEALSDCAANIRKARIES